MFTWCFQHAILAAVPPITFFLTLPVLWIQLRGERNGVLPWSLLISVKQVCLKIGIKIEIF